MYNRKRKMYKNLEKAFIEHDVHIKTMCNHLGFNTVTLLTKRNGDRDFKCFEMFNIRDYLNENFGQNYTLDYLFEE